MEQKETCYACYENDYTGTRTVSEWQAIYETVIDKEEYPEFTDWLYDMIRSGILVEVQQKGKVSYDEMV